MRLRPDAAAQALDADRLAIVHPDGRRWVHHAPGAAQAAADALRAGGTAGLETFLEEQGLAWGDDAAAPHALLLHRQQPPPLPVRAGLVRVHGEGRVAHWLRATLAEMDVPCGSWTPDGPDFFLMGSSATGAATTEGPAGTEGTSTSTAPGTAQPAPRPPDLLVHAADGLDRTELAAANLAAMRAGLPFMAACGWEARRILVGPLAVPGETACAQCWLDRRDQNAWSPLQPPAADLPEGAARVAGTLAAWEAARFQQGALPATLGAAVTLSLDGLDSQRDEVVRAPRCAACGRHARVPPVQAWLPLPRGE